jgi:hypothetical protein
MGVQYEKVVSASWLTAGGGSGSGIFYIGLANGIFGRVWLVRRNPALRTVNLLRRSHSALKIQK